MFDDDGRRGMAVDSDGGGWLHHFRRLRESLAALLRGAGAFLRPVAGRGGVARRSISAATADLGKVIIDQGCVIPPGTVVGENPEEDARRFYRTEQGVILITREMLGQS
ncbi:MAG: hypothetical protein MZV65_25135 [Chromatiales bacterium]|nr:hypothetical protein [Chromatiales bacterium]